MRTEEEQDAAYALLRCLWDWLRVDEEWEAHWSAVLSNEISRNDERAATRVMLEEHTRPLCKRIIKEGFIPSHVQDIMTTTKEDRRDFLIELEELVNDDYGTEIPF